MKQDEDAARIPPKLGNKEHTVSVWWMREHYLPQTAPATPKTQTCHSAAIRQATGLSLSHQDPSHGTTSSNQTLHQLITDVVFMLHTLPLPIITL